MSIDVAAVSPPVMSLPYQQRSVWGIIQDSLKLYKDHGLAFSRELVIPTLLVTLTPFFAIWICFRIIYAARDIVWSLTGEGLLGIILMLAIAIISCFTTMLPFFKGFWSLFVYSASMNTNTIEVLEGRTPDFKGAYNQIPKKPYTNLLVLLMGLWLLPMVLMFPIMLSIGLVPMFGPAALVGVLVCSVPFLAVCAGLVYLGPAFQIQAFEPTDLNPIPTLKASWRLVKGNFWRTGVLLLGWALLSNTIGPVLVIGILGFLRVTALLSALFAPLASEICETSLQPVMPQLMTQLGQTQPEIAQYLSVEMANMLTTGMVMAALLPFGTFCFALLYLDLKARQQKTA